MTPEEIANIPLLDLDDVFPFVCKECGKCCKNREDILLTSWDVFRLARHFKCETGDIILKYCEVYPGSDSKLPVVRLIPKPYNKTCTFLRNGKCSLHFTDAKPVLCRTFPLARMNKGGGERGYYYNPTTCGMKGISVVRDFVGDAGSDASNEASDVWTEAIFKITPILLKAFKKSQDSYQALFQTAFILLYCELSTDKDFAAQLRRNLKIFINHAG
jgi:hypothetical protein